MKNILLLLFSLFYGFSAQCQMLKSGDMLFQISGSSPFAKAITASTSNKGILEFGHVAMIYKLSDNTWVIEADPEAGVRLIKLEDFLSSSPKVNGRPGVVAMRVSNEIPINDIIIRAVKFLGQPYDWWYLPENGKIYCSELIYEAYRDKKGKPIFESHPMRFRDSDGSIPMFWTDLYESLGVPVPEGEPGTNPNDMYKSEILTEIYRFF